MNIMKNEILAQDDKGILASFIDQFFVASINNQEVVFIVAQVNINIALAEILLLSILAYVSFRKQNL